MAPGKTESGSKCNQFMMNLGVVTMHMITVKKSICNWEDMVTIMIKYNQHHMITYYSVIIFIRSFRSLDFCCQQVDEIIIAISAEKALLCLGQSYLSIHY